MSKNSFRRVSLNLEILEDRDVPSTVSLGAAGGYAVLGIGDAQIVNFDASITGNEGVSKGGYLTNTLHSAIAGNVVESRDGQYLGRGKLTGSLTADAATLSAADSAALAASEQADALKATQSFKDINTPTTVTGDGGLNVIDISGDINNSLILKGTANDIFIVNVKGSVTLDGKETLGLAGGVAADQVLYNFVGAHGNVSTRDGNVIDGTLLGPNYGFFLNGKIDGEIIGGDGSFVFLDGAKVTEASFAPAPAAPLPGSLSGSVLNDGGAPIAAGITIHLEDSSGNILQTVVTSDGAYSFTGLQAGTYQLVAVQTGAWAGVSAQPGTVNGVVDGSSTGTLTIGSITLSNGGVGINYDFSLVSGG